MRCADSFDLTLVFHAAEVVEGRRLEGREDGAQLHVESPYQGSSSLNSIAIPIFLAPTAYTVETKTSPRYHDRRHRRLICWPLRPKLSRKAHGTVKRCNEARDISLVDTGNSVRWRKFSRGLCYAARPVEVFACISVNDSLASLQSSDVK